MTSTSIPKPQKQCSDESTQINNNEDGTFYYALKKETF